MLNLNRVRKIAIVLLLVLVGPYVPLNALSTRTGPVRLSETYELANIMLALTDYGKADPWEVNQHSAYYQEVRTYFNRYADHPLLSEINYSREKWENYLSFRTDAYAFQFDQNNHLVRVVDFHANKGLRPFDDHLDLINDFVERSGFRQFYRDHLPYYQRLATDYLQSQHYDEMLRFLEQELGRRHELRAYAIVLSPLVGRMNCHRTVAGVGTDFSTLPDFLLTGKASHQATPAEVASGTHMLFTELDHAFVNPVTDRHRAFVMATFDPGRWDGGSGYEKDTNATFNEYMTWAVYNLYVHTHFPAVAANVSQDWALQNATRGFFASSLFNQELLRIYEGRSKGQTLQTIYPVFIRRLGALQQTLSMPRLIDCKRQDPVATDSVAELILCFSEPMQTKSTIDLIQGVEQQGKLVGQQRVVLTPETNTLNWSDRGRRLRFRLALLKGGTNYILFNYPWKTHTVVQSCIGVDLKPYTRVRVPVHD